MLPDSVPAPFERALAVQASSVRVARRLGHRVCGSWRLSQTARDDVELVIGELAGNAVRHGASGTMLLRLAMTARYVRIELCENSPGRPVVRQPDLEAESGRGLWLVEALSDRWGVEPDRLGKRTWAELAVTACP